MRAPAVLYQPAETWPIARHELLLHDPERSGYDVPLQITRPVGAPGPRPVVLWNHGGSPSQGPTRQQHTVPMAEAMARAGYVSLRSRGSGSPTPRIRESGVAYEVAAYQRRPAPWPTPPS